MLTASLTIIFTELLTINPHFLTYVYSVATRSSLMNCALRAYIYTSHTHFTLLLSAPLIISSKGSHGAQIDRHPPATATDGAGILPQLPRHPKVVIFLKHPFHHYPYGTDAARDPQKSDYPRAAYTLGGGHIVLQRAAAREESATRCGEIH